MFSVEKTKWKLVIKPRYLFERLESIVNEHPLPDLINSLRTKYQKFTQHSLIITWVMFIK